MEYDEFKGIEEEVVTQETFLKNEEVEIGPDVGEFIVIRCSLSVTKKGDNQRQVVFYTKGTIRGKLCSLIVDRGSCTDVASKTLVDKLKLITTPHLKLFQVKWLT